MIFEKLLRCPICISPLDAMGTQLKCTNPACGAVYPIVKGVPILINEAMSIYSIADFTIPEKQISQSALAKLKRLVWNIVPNISGNIRAERNFGAFIDLLLASSPAPRVLVIGGRIPGEGMNKLLATKSIELVETDVEFGPRTSLVCDAHCLPFDNGSFDGVIAQAVLEHVVDPLRCVEEVYRVLRHQGLIYAETPFMQQVHMGAHDFTRFTHLGHRRLFRQFDEVNSGAVCGPGMSLAWSYRYFILSFANSKRMRTALHVFASFTSFFLKYFDYFLIDKKGTFDAASGYFFLGRKSKSMLSDRELVKLYRGAVE